MSFNESLGKLLAQAVWESDSLAEASANDASNFRYCENVRAFLNPETPPPGGDDLGVTRRGEWFPVELSSLWDLLGVIRPRNETSPFELAIRAAVQSARREPDAPDLQQKIERLRIAHERLVDDWQKRARRLPSRDRPASVAEHAEAVLSLRRLHSEDDAATEADNNAARSPAMDAAGFIELLQRNGKSTASDRTISRKKKDWGAVEVAGTNWQQFWFPLDQLDRQKVQYPPEWRLGTP